MTLTVDHDVRSALEFGEQPAPPASEAIDAARQEVQRLFDLEQHQAQQYLQTAAEIAQLEAGAGAAIVDGTDPDELADRIQGATRKLGLLDKTIIELRTRRVAAIKACFAAEAAELRRRAAEITRAADERQVKTDELLAQLRDWEGVDYIPDTRPQAEDGVFDRQVDQQKIHTVPERNTMWFGRVPESQLWGADVVYVTAPRTQILRNQASDLEQRAQLLEQRQVVAGGELIARSRDELLSELAARGPMQLVPPLHKLHAWLDAAEANEQKRRAGKTEFELRHMGQVRYQVYWKGPYGELDERESFVGPL